MTSQSQVTGGNRWIGFRGGPDELRQCWCPSQCYVVLAVMRSLFSVRHRFHVAQKGADVESTRFPTVLNVWPVLAPSELLVLSSASHELFVVPLGTRLSAWRRWALETGLGSGWCREATGHQWTGAFAPASFLLWSPFFPPSLPLSCTLLPLGLPGTLHLSLYQKYRGMSATLQSVTSRASLTFLIIER